MTVLEKMPSIHCPFHLINMLIINSSLQQQATKIIVWKSFRKKMQGLIFHKKMQVFKNIKRSLLNTRTLEICCLPSSIYKPEKQKHNKLLLTLYCIHPSKMIRAILSLPKSSYSMIPRDASQTLGMQHLPQYLMLKKKFVSHFHFTFILLEINYLS